MHLLDRTALPSGDHLDELLRAYFRAEMPAAWPVPAVDEARPTVVPLAAKRTGLSTLARGRLALAASIALLIGAGLYAASLVGLGSRPDQTVPPSLYDG